jgi:hypothetical protein
MAGGRVQILDLDGSLIDQAPWLRQWPLQSVPANPWGPDIRLAGSFRAFDRFARWLDAQLPVPGPGVTLYGSGDFHHVTLAFLRRLREPFHLLVLDKHPDWMRGIPFLHCGTWLRHALRLPGLQRVFHCGGVADFDNAYRHLAPWPEIRAGRVLVFPAERRFAAGWTGIEQNPLRGAGGSLGERLRQALAPHASELARFPLYISIDKDVLVAEDAAVNWDSGCLRLEEACEVLATFLELAGGRWLGADLLGDWSSVRLGHWLNRLNHRLDHPSPETDLVEAAERNGRANQALLEVLLGPAGKPTESG